jgi:hypothetical protein
VVSRTCQIVLGFRSQVSRSFTDSHMRLEEGGWARETTVRELPSSRELAGVNMRLGPGAYRELHWHNESEWAYIIKVCLMGALLRMEQGLDLPRGLVESRFSTSRVDASSMTSRKAICGTSPQDFPTVFKVSLLP